MLIIAICVLSPPATRLPCQSLTEKVDIYAMGMIYFSLISGGVPFPDQEAFERAYGAKLRPEIDPSWHKGFTRVSPPVVFTEDITTIARP